MVVILCFVSFPYKNIISTKESIIADFITFLMSAIAPSCSGD